MNKVGVNLGSFDLLFVIALHEMQDRAVVSHQVE